MALFEAIKKTLGKSPAAQPAAPSAKEQAAGREPEPASQPVIVAEIQSGELIPLYRSGAGPSLLDCREPFEWAQVRIPGSVHIPMNDIPARLGELDAGADWVVVCAHGNRSFAVAGYLLRNGLQARSLAGGVTDWWMRGGETESDYPTTKRT